jgi:hypothetical protein
VNLAADNLHLILLHELSIKKAWGAGQIKVKGPVWKLKVLTDLVQGAREYYPTVLKEHEAAKGQAAPKPAAKTATKKAGH